MASETLTIDRMGRSGFRLQSSIWVPQPRRALFPFFADAQNLDALTPPDLGFRILTSLPSEMRTGTLIDYRLSLHGIPFRWRTLIMTWDPPMRFVDVQLRGPYRWWVHEHRFVDEDGGTRLEDDVDYGVPGGWLIHDRLVRPRLEEIFRYRARAIRERFG